MYSDGIRSSRRSAVSGSRSVNEQRPEGWCRRGVGTNPPFLFPYLCPALMSGSLNNAHPLSWNLGDSDALTHFATH